MYRRSVTRKSASLACLVLAIVAAWGSAAELPEKWPAIEKDLQRRATLDLERDRRKMWDYLAEYLGAQLERVPTEEARREILQWSQYLVQHEPPILLGKVYSLAATRQIGSIRWRANTPDPYRLCLLPVPGQLLLFAYPDRKATTDTRVMTEMHLKELSPKKQGEYLPNEARKKIQQEVRRAGYHRWPFVLVPLLRDPPVNNNVVPQVEVIEDRIVVQLRDQRMELPLPDDDTLSGQIGLAFDKSEIPPPGNRTLYLALDWSEYMAAAHRHEWLIGELKSALDSVPPHWLEGEAVYLHNGETATPWPLADLMNDRWPDPPLPPHHCDTLKALSASIRDANRLGNHLKLVFFTWYSELTVNMDHWAATEVHVELARNVNLRVIQVGDKDLEVFESIAGKERYDRVEYVPESTDASRASSFRFFDESG